MLTGYFNYANIDLVIEDLVAVLIKTLLSIVTLFLLTKLMGNKQISQLSFFDYVVGITVGSIGADLATSSTPIHLSLIALILYALVSVIISLATLKSIRARRFFIGTPIPLIIDGKIITKNLKSAKVDINELLAEARVQGYFDIANISHAVMETNGRFSFLTTSNNKPLTPQDMDIQVEKVYPVANVIIDGVIMENNLLLYKKDKKWLENKLSQKNIDLKKVLLATMSKEYILNIYYNTGEKSILSPFD